jgi:hypothetical protein
VQGLALVELGVDPPPELLALQVAQDKDRLHQATVLLQGTDQGGFLALRPAEIIPREIEDAGFRLPSSYRTWGTAGSAGLGRESAFRMYAVRSGP